MTTIQSHKANKQHKASNVTDHDERANHSITNNKMFKKKGVSRGASSKPPPQVHHLQPPSSIMTMKNDVPKKSTNNHDDDDDTASMHTDITTLDMMTDIWVLKRLNPLTNEQDETIECVLGASF